MQELAWDDVRCFLEVAAAGSLSGAARRLGVRHSTLSRRLAALERQVGQPLLRRTRDGVELTPAGDEVLELARAAQAPMLAVQRKLVALAEGGGRVRLATSSILAAGLLAPHVAELTAACPGLGLELLVSRRLVHLGRGEAELALRLRPPGAWVAEPSVVVSVLGRVRWAAYSTGPLGGARRVITFSGENRPGAAWSAARLVQVPPLLVDDVPTALALASEGVGAAVLPCFLADAVPALRYRSELLDEHRLVVAVPRSLARTPPTRRVITWLREVAALHKARLEGHPARPRQRLP